MNLHRVRRISETLVASQVRAARTGTDPTGFFARGSSILVYDLVVFVLTVYVSEAVIRALAATQPGIPAAAASLGEPILPAIALGAVFVAGILFELTTTARFAASDAVNWLPVTPSEYVLASTIAVSYSYSIALAAALGVGAGIAIASGSWAAYAVAAPLSVVALGEGGVLIEILRSVTQRASTVMGRRSGRVTILLRIVVLVLVVLAFEILVNPELLIRFFPSAGLVQTLAPSVPLLWGTAAVFAAGAGDLLRTGVFAAGQVALAVLFAALAVELRGRFWSVAPTEVQLEVHAYGERHPVLSAVGFGRAGAAIAAKDLHGLTRRRELVPMLVLPIVLGAIGLLGVGGSSPGTAPAFTPILWVAWVSGFYALLLSTTSIGQERRGVQHLYALPVDPGTVFRAKAGTVVLLGLAFGLVWSVALVGIYRLAPIAVAALALLVVATVFEGTFLGLAFAARYSDFQERPRPQYLRPSAMFAAMMTGIVLLFGTIVPILFALVQSAHPAAPELAGGLAAALLAIAVSYWSARTGFTALLREVPF